jgi:hypothetical protein
MEATITLATPANMRAIEEANRGRTIKQPGGELVHVEGRRAMAISPSTGEEYSASSGDYWNHADDEPITDSEGEPMILVFQRTVYVDALTGEQV